MNNQTTAIQNEVNKVILGKADVVRSVLLAILAGGHVLLEDVPGVGKTTLAMAFAKTLGLSTGRVQFTSDTLPSDVIGFSVFDKSTQSLRYQPGAVMTNLLLADEINRTSSKTQSALLEAMEEGRVTVDGVTHPLPQPFIVLATQNPIGSTGTQMLPASQLDRFLLCMSMGYPDLQSQIDLMRERHHDDPLDACRAVTDPDSIRALCRAAMNVYVADSVYAYIACIAEETRRDEDVLLGVSPRGALSLCRASKANAFLHGRDYVLPQDAAEIVPAVCAHRLTLSAKARLHERTAKDVLRDVLSRVPQPAVREFTVR